MIKQHGGTPGVEETQEVEAGKAGCGLQVDWTKVELR